jgi:hypothetical protein
MSTQEATADERLELRRNPTHVLVVVACFAVVGGTLGVLAITRATETGWNAAIAAQRS